MEQSILITGGGGFIGSHLARELLAHNVHVRALDNLSPQVHGNRHPDYLPEDVELVPGDIRDPDAVRHALDGIDAVFHFAAAVGVGQSMYEIERYTSINNLGTAVLLEALTKRPVEKLIVASSMSVYGEGEYIDQSGRLCSPPGRRTEQLTIGQWELEDETGRPLLPVPTAETKPLAPASVYALSKYDQEQLCLIVGRAYKIPTAALRFFNAYGPHQALSNPYTGVLAIFASRLLNNRPPVIFEDGRQQRDFVHVTDVARCCRLAWQTPEAQDMVINVGSGKACSVLEVEESMRKAMNKGEIQPVVSGKFRQGDIRHCFADITRARTILGYQPRVDLHQGLIGLTQWLEGQIAEDRLETASAELDKRGLTL